MAKISSLNSGMMITNARLSYTQTRLGTKSSENFKKYYNTSIEMLCEKAMISRTTFFNYFGNKEKLIKLIMEDGLKDLYEMIDSLDIDAENDPEECFMKVILFQMEAVRKYKNTTFVFYRMLMEDEECRQIQKAYDEAISAVLDRIQDKWDFRKKYSRQWIEHSIGGAFMHIVILEPEEEWETSLRDNIGGILDMMR